MPVIFHFHFHNAFLSNGSDFKMNLLNDDENFEELQRIIDEA